jgi:hypothetical protein
MAVTLKDDVFWEVIPCGSCKNRRFGETYRFHHQGDVKNPDSMSSQRASVASYC